MNCNRWREQASDYIEGNLPAGEAAAMREHLLSCPSCRADEDSLRTLWRDLTVLPAPEPPMFFRDNVISAVERQGSRSGYYPGARPSLRERVFGPQTRWALGGSLVTAAAAGILFVAANGAKSPDALTSTAAPPAAATSASTPKPPAVAQASLAARLLPYSGEFTDSGVVETTRKLLISRTESVTPSDGKVMDFTFWLENAGKGMVRFRSVAKGGGGGTPYRFLMSGSRPQVIRVPLAVAQGEPTLGLEVQWTGDGERHVRHIFVPVRENGSEADSRQAFGLPQMSVLDAAREVSARYGRPVTLENVPEDLRVTIYARNETASQALRRHLEGRGLTVTSSASGILVVPAAKGGRAAAPVVDPTLQPSSAATGR